MSVQTAWLGGRVLAFLFTVVVLSPSLAGQVSAVLWPGGWLNRFFCFGLSFLSLSLFLFPSHIPSSVS